MGFETGEKPVKTIIHEAPDFKKTLNDYHQRVKEINSDLKARSDELAGVLKQLAQAKVDLQAQYDKKVSDLGTDIDTLQAKITDLQAQSDSLDKEIQTKQDLKNAIVTDNLSERQRLNDSWAEFHLAVEAYSKDKDKVDWAQQSLLNANTELEKAKKDFMDYKTATLADIDQKIAAANDLMEKAKSKENEGITILQTANTALDALTRKKAELDIALAKAEPIIVRANEIQAQAEKNIKDQVINDAQALQNQKDIDQIKVARIALNNQKHELDAREANITAAEQKIGG